MIIISEINIIENKKCESLSLGCLDLKHRDTVQKLRHMSILWVEIIDTAHIPHTL